MVPSRAMRPCILSKTLSWWQLQHHRSPIERLPMSPRWLQAIALSLAGVFFPHSCVRNIKTEGLGQQNLTLRTREQKLGAHFSRALPFLQPWIDSCHIQLLVVPGISCLTPGFIVPVT